MCFVWLWFGLFKNSAFLSKVIRGGFWLHQYLLFILLIALNFSVLNVNLKNCQWLLKKESFIFAG